MVLSGRPSRADGGRPGGGPPGWLVLGLVITSVVLLVDASIKSADPARARQLGAQAWMDRSLAVVAQSNVQASELAGFRAASVTGVTAAGVSADLAAVATGAQTTYRQLVDLRAPSSLVASAGLLQTCLLLRSRAAATIATVVETSLGAPSGATGVGVLSTAVVRHDGATTSAATTAAARPEEARALAAAGEQLQLADQAYRLFVTALPASTNVTAPASAWVADPGLYAPAPLQVFLGALQARVSLAPLHRLELLSVGTTPAPMGTSGPGRTVEILLPSADLAVTAIVGNVGNQDETGLTVTAALSASTGTASVSQPLALGAGAVAALTLTHLAPRLGTTITLTVTVRAPAGSPTASVHDILRFVMPSPTATPATVGTSTTTG